MTCTRRRWAVIVWKLPLFLTVAFISALLELATTITWRCYVAADRLRDRFIDWWHGFRCELPTWWELET